MKIIFVGCIFLYPIISFSQKNTTNSWFLLQFRLDSKRFFQVVELGHRRQDAFLTNHRQSLFRYTLSYQTRSKRTGFGGGIACFIHERKAGRELETETRPFLQLTRLFPLKGGQFQLRFRNEFRFFDRSTKDQDRLRAQMLFSHSLIQKLQTKLTYFNEWFYSVGQTQPWEWRGGIWFSNLSVRTGKLD